MTKRNRKPRFQTEEERHQNDSYRYKKTMLRVKDPKHAKERKTREDEWEEYPDIFDEEDTE